MDAFCLKVEFHRGESATNGVTLLALSLVRVYIGLIQVKEEGWTQFSKGWQGCSEGFPEGEAQGKSQRAALPA